MAITIKLDDATIRWMAEALQTPLPPTVVGDDILRRLAALPRSAPTTPPVYTGAGPLPSMLADGTFYRSAGLDWAGRAWYTAHGWSVREPTTGSATGERSTHPE